MNYLYHYGIKGQKWGVRRYQNKDGSRKYEAKTKAIEDKRAFREDVRYVKKHYAGSTVDFAKKRTSQKGEAYVKKVYNRATSEMILSGAAKATAVAATAAVLYKLSR